MVFGERQLLTPSKLGLLLLATALLQLWDTTPPLKL